ncbi:MAG: matrixin family metalloprotease [Thermoanaerobaculia bacterium]
MDSRRLSRFSCLLSCSLLLTTVTAAQATTVKLVSDTNLVDQARIIVLARSLGTMPSPALDRPVTEYLMNVERVLKGNVGESNIVVRVLGGRAADGMELKIWGAPTFVEGERALLFLGRHADGTYGILHFMLGAFHEGRIENRAVAFRDLAEVDVLDSAEVQANEKRTLRDLDLFADWIVDRAALHTRVPDYLVRVAGNSQNSLLPMFTLLSDGGHNTRWFEFDNGGQVQWRIDGDPLAGLSSSPVEPFRNALAAWTNESHTPIRLTYAGTSSLTAGFQTFDHQNVLLFDDPNEDIEGAFTCAAGGTLAIGGPWYDSDVTGRFNGETYIRIQGGDVVLNDGLSCFFENSSNPAKGAEELFTHEVGHTLGLGHSSENSAETNSAVRDAIMYFRIHNDGRGARLAPDDIAGLRRLYDKTATSGGGGGGGGGTSGCPAGNLCLVNGRFQVSAVWNSQFDGSSGSAGPIKSTDLAGFLYFTDPSNIELIVKVLDFGDRVLFFYGELTNLHFTISVRDTTTGITKTYQNTAGDCGGLDNNLAASSALFETGPASLAPMAGCQSSANAICLGGGRFKAELTWRNQFDGSTGRGVGKKLSELTGAFSFNDPANLEVLVKTLDFGDHVLVLYGTLSNLEYSLSVTDTRTGRVKGFFNPANTYCGGIDTNAF